MRIMVHLHKALDMLLQRAALVPPSGDSRVVLPAMVKVHMGAVIDVQGNHGEVLFEMRDISAIDD
jgi:hypothetical protein